MSRIGIYLNDHLAGAVAAGELAGRAAASNRGNDYGEALSRLAEEIREDRTTLRDVMQQLGVGPDRLKVVAAWTGEKLGRFKLNGSVVSYSPLSRLEELEILLLGVEGKLLMWQALSRTSSLAERLEDVDLDALIGRANSQLRTLMRLRLNAAAEAFGAD